MATTATYTLRFARRPKDAGVPDAQAETMAEPVFTLLASVSPMYLAADAAGVPLPTVAAVLRHASLAPTAIDTTAFGTEVREPLTRAHLPRVRTEVVTGRSNFPST